MQIDLETLIHDAGHHDPARLATVDQVEVIGASLQPALVGELYQQFEDYNERLFFGRLPAPRITIDDLGERALGCFSVVRDDAGQQVPMIRVHRLAFGLTSDPRIAHAILLHEASHFNQWLSHDPLLVRHPHGRFFINEARRLAQMQGITWRMKWPAVEFPFVCWAHSASSFAAASLKFQMAFRDFYCRLAENQRARAARPSANVRRIAAELAEHLQENTVGLQLLSELIEQFTSEKYKTLQGGKQCFWI